MVEPTVCEQSCQKLSFECCTLRSNCVQVCVGSASKEEDWWCFVVSLMTIYGRIQKACTFCC